MQDFVYVCPDTIEAAVAALLDGEARALAGGTDLIPQIKEGRCQVSRIVDLKRIRELTAITPRPDGGVTIGAAATATAVSRHAAIADAYPAVARSARLIGGVQIQNRASLGGNICNAAPSADGVPALLCHEARAVIAGGKGRREIALADLFLGPGRTTLERGELLVSIELPPPPSLSAAAYLRFTPRREMDIAVAGVATWIRIDEHGAIAEARVVLASVGPTAMRTISAEQRLLGEQPTQAALKEAGRIAAEAARPISDTRGSAEYRRKLVAVLTERALAECCETIQRKVQAA